MDDPYCVGYGSLETESVMNTWSFCGRIGISRWMLTATLALCALSLGAQQGTPVEGESTLPEDLDQSRRDFSLGLDANGLSGEGRENKQGFSLGITDRQTASEDEKNREPDGQLEFSLYAGVGDEKGTLPGIGPDFYDELAARRWPGAKTRLNSALAAQYARVLEGGRVGAYGGDVGVLTTLDFVAMARLAVLWWQTYKLGQLPPGASIPTDATLTLEVRDADGGVPGHISVLPLTQGWIGDAVHARCDDRGRCVAEDLPSASSTLLVRGDGGVLVRWDHVEGEISVSLRPTGSLQILPAQCCPEVRVLEEKSDAIVPVIQWINPGREEWVRVPSGGLTLSLPEGRYTIQTNLNSERSFVDVTVAADQVSTVEVGY